MFAELLLVLARLAPAASIVDIETPHYRLAWDGARADAVEAGEVLEQTWSELAAFFGEKPDAKTKLLVRVYPDETSRLRGAWNDGALVPTQCKIVSFSESTRAIYVARQPSAYTTRNALIYGACLQFHSLCKSKNIDITRTWYGSGIAHGFARHRWDGRKLEVMARPLVTPVDLPAQALSFLSLDEKLPSLDEGLLLDAPMSWGTVALCLRGAEGRYLKPFRQWALGVGGSKMSGEDFLRTLGDGQVLARELRTFLAREQAPFEAVGTEWEDRGSRGLLGRTDVGLRTMCVLKDACHRLSASMSALPKMRASAGFVAGYWSPEDCVLIRIEAPAVTVETLRLGRVTGVRLFPIPGDAAKPHRIELTRRGADAVIAVDEAILGPFEVGGGRTGFFVEGAEVVLREVTWK